MSNNKTKLKNNTNSRNDLINVLKKWLYIEDEQAVDIVLTTIIANFLPGDPVWLFLIAPPGGMKTELVRGFKDENFYSLSTVTPQTLISGLKGNNKPDLLQELNNKILILKDFTSILSKNPDDLKAIFADLREAYDGSLAKSYGSGIGTKEIKSKFGIIACVTSYIDKSNTMQSVLGERFLKCRMKSNETNSINKAMETQGKEDIMRKEIEDASATFISSYKKLINNQCEIPFDETTLDIIKSLGNIGAKLRSEVDRDRYHNILYLPQPEIGTRLVKQIEKVAVSMAILYQHNSIGQPEIDAIIRLIGDGIPELRIKIVSLLAKSSSLDTRTISYQIKFPFGTTRTQLENLLALGLIEQTGIDKTQWQLTKDLKQLYINSGLYKYN